MLSGQGALVTGGAQGLGKGFAEAMLKEEAKVVLVDNNEEKLTETGNALRAKHGHQNVYWVRADVTVDRELEEAFEKADKTLGYIDIVANNAGILDESKDKWKKMVDINATAVIRGTQLAVEYMSKKDSKGGCIINTASVAGLYDMPLIPIYCATKSAVIAYSSALAMFPKTQKDNIRINCLCPHFTNTAILDLTPDQVVDINELNKLASGYSLLTVPSVAEGFMTILRNKEKTGVCLQVDSVGETWIQFKKPLPPCPQ